MPSNLANVAATVLLGLPNQPAFVPPRTADAAKPPAIAAAAEAVPKAAPVTVAATPGGGFVAHVASYRDEAAARTGWAELRRQAPGLATTEPRFLAVTIPGKGPWVRVAAGHFSSQSEATGFCASLKGMVGYCRPLAVAE